MDSQTNNILDFNQSSLMANLSCINDYNDDDGDSDWDEKPSNFSDDSSFLKDISISSEISANDNDQNDDKNNNLQLEYNDTNYQLSIKTNKLPDDVRLELLLNHIIKLKKIQTKHMKLANKNLKLRNKEIEYAIYTQKSDKCDQYTDTNDKNND